MAKKGRGKKTVNKLGNNGQPCVTGVEVQIQVQIVLILDRLDLIS